MYIKRKATAALLAALMVLAVAVGATAAQVYYTDLTDLVKNVSITGAEVSGNTWTVRPDTRYDMSVVFQETGNRQFDMESPSLTYRLPDGITFGDATQIGNGELSFLFGATTYKLQYSYTVAPDGSVEITPDYAGFVAEYGDQILNALKQATRLQMKIDFTGEFHRENEHLEWGNHVETDVIVDLEEEHDLQIEKIAQYDPEGGCINYTLRVTSEGSNRNIVVKDTIAGNALRFDGAVSISGAGSSTCTPVSDTEATFEYAIDSMTDGQVIEFTYSATIDYEKDSDRDGQLTYDQTHNTADMSGDGTDEKHVNWGNQIQFSSVSKGNGQVIGGDGQTQTVSWTVEVNKERIISIGGTELTDSIVPGSLPMQYSGSGITVTVYDTAGNTVGDPIFRSWADLGVDPSTATSYTYRFPETDEIYYYEIAYTTDVDVSSLAGDGTVSNTATGKHGHDTGSAGITGDDESKPKLTKDAIDYDINEVTWQVVIRVPAEGLAPEYSLLRDDLPSAYFRYYDEYVEDSLYVSGLWKGDPDDDTDDDTYTETHQGHSFNIQFKKADGTNGLTGIDAAYDVYVTFKTKNNKDWISAAASDSYLNDHINRVYLGTIHTSASAPITSPAVNKYMDKSESIYNEYIHEIDGVRYVSYNIVVGPIMSGEISATIRDEFDTNIFRVPTDAEAGDLYQQFSLLGGGQYWQGDDCGKALYNSTSYGIDIVIPDIPDDARTGNNYEYLRVHYYLALKDDVDLDLLAAEAGGKWTTTNKAIWNDVSGEATFEHDYICLDKELTNLGEIDNDHRIAKYRITFNPQQGLMNNGEDIVLRDTWSESLNIDYTSIRITTVPESANDSVSYTISGYTATYTIPDQTKVIIEYNALVLGNGPVEFGNEVNAAGWEDKTEDRFTFKTDSEATGVGIYFPVLKVDESNNCIRIPGVKFKLTAPNGYPLKDDEELYEVILETDENGVLLIDQSKYVLYFYDAGGTFVQDDPRTYIVYTLAEVEPAEGYAPVDIVYTMSFTDDIDQVTFDGAYIYPAAGGSLQIKNKPLEGLTVRKKTVGDDSGKGFHFMVTLDDTSVNGIYGKMDDQGRYDGHEVEFVNGVAEFTLKDGEYKQAVGLPSGVGYTIVETAEDDFATVSTGRTTADVTLPTGGTTYTGTTRVEETEVTFENTKTLPTSITFQATKVITGREMTGGEFTFGVYDENGREVQRVKNDENGVVSFETIPYTLADLGTHTYTVKEIVPEGVTAENPTKDGYTYDLKSYTITVEVAYYGEGILRAGITNITENK